MTPLIPIVLIGGAAYTLVGSDGAEQEAPPTQGPVPRKLAELNASMPSIISASQLMKRFGGGGVVFASTQNSAVDPELQKKLDEIEAAAREQFDNMDDVAKVEAIDKINQNLGTDLPLDADLSWETISMAAYGAAGAAAGAYVCGPVCGKVGALAAAYLGAKLNDLLAKTYDELTKDLFGGEQSITSYQHSYDAWKAARIAAGKTATDAEWQAFRDERGADVFRADFDDLIIVGVVAV